MASLACVCHQYIPTLQNCKLRPLEILQQRLYSITKHVQGDTPCASAFLPSFLLLLLLGIAGLYATRPAQACPLAADCQNPCCQEREYFWDFYGTRKCKCTNWDYVCLGQVQPPTMTGNLSCARPGNGSWCLGGLNLHLEASDPQGQSLLIYGKISGVDFACPAAQTVCDVPISLEGNGLAEFTALSATTLSDSDTLPYWLDASPPPLDLTLSGAPGLNGWFVSAVDVSASASDSVSGLASLEISLDGGAYAAYQAPISLADGAHTLAFKAYDIAGNLTEMTQNVNVDSLTPELTLSLNGAPGANGWYLTPLEVAAAASDAGSGLSTWNTCWTAAHGRPTPRRSPFPKACTVTNSAPLTWRAT